MSSHGANDPCRSNVSKMCDNLDMIGVSRNKEREIHMV